MTSEILNNRRISIESDLTQIARDCLMFVNRNESDKDLTNFKEVQKVRVAIKATCDDLTRLIREVELDYTRFENEITNLRENQNRLKRIVELETELKILKGDL